MPLETFFHGAVLGLHLATAHINPSAIQGGAHAFNPGVYVRLANGATAGVYRNSYGNTSVYAGYTAEALGRHVALTVGGVTGYGARTVCPLVVPSVRLGLTDTMSLRIAYLPKPPHYGHTAGVHFSIEGRF